jgi:hypothetical protein
MKKKFNLVLTDSMLKRAKKMGVSLELLRVNRVRVTSNGSSYNPKTFVNLLSLIVKGNPDFTISDVKFGKDGSLVYILKFRPLYEVAYEESKALMKSYLSNFSSEVEQVLRGASLTTRKHVFALIDNFKI